nr:histidine kinase dimerization/phospho-acceptor domain-containing protein [Egicoccus halophilus]
MEALATTSRDLLSVAYVLLAVTAAWQFVRRRQLPAAHLATAFGALAVGLFVGRVSVVVDAVWVAQGLAVAAVAAFPWLMAAFAWSFDDGPLPRWLRLGPAVVLTVSAAFVLAAPDGGGVRDGNDLVFYGLFLGAWLLPSAAAAARLLGAGGTSRVVRARMHLLAVSLILLSTAVVATVGVGSARPAAQVAVNALCLAAAALSAAAFAPPLPLRMWWRRQGAHHFQLMQQQLIAAVTPGEAARAMAPILASQIGAGTAVFGIDGDVLASAELSRDEAEAIAARLAAGDSPHVGTQVVPLTNATLVVRLTPYSPFFGDYERELTTAYAWQLQLALERSELAAKHLAALAQVERANRELEATLLGLSHDLRSPAVAIGGYSALLRSVATDEERAPLLDGIAASSAYLNGLVDALLDLARLGRDAAVSEPVDLSRVARTVRERVAVTAPRSRIDLDPRPAGAPARPRPRGTGAGQPGHQRGQARRARRSAGAGHVPVDRRRGRAAGHRRRPWRGDGGRRTHLRAVPARTQRGRCWLRRRSGHGPSHRRALRRRGRAGAPRARSRVRRVPAPPPARRAAGTARRRRRRRRRGPSRDRGTTASVGPST